MPVFLIVYLKKLNLCIRKYQKQKISRGEDEKVLLLLAFTRHVRNLINIVGVRREIAGNLKISPTNMTRVLKFNDIMLLIDKDTIKK